MMLTLIRIEIILTSGKKKNKTLYYLVKDWKSVINHWLFLYLCLTNQANIYFQSLHQVKILRYTNFNIYTMF